MLWLDSTYPTDADPDSPGKTRGTCDTGSGVPADVESDEADNKVVYCKVPICTYTHQMIGYSSRNKVC